MLFLFPAASVRDSGTGAVRYRYFPRLTGAWGSGWDPTAYESFADEHSAIHNSGTGAVRYRYFPRLTGAWGSGWDPTAYESFADEHSAIDGTGAVGVPVASHERNPRAPVDGTPMSVLFLVPADLCSGKRWGTKPGPMRYRPHGGLLIRPMRWLLIDSRQRRR